MIWLWLDFLFLAVFFDGALLVTWLANRDFPLPAAPNGDPR